MVSQAMRDWHKNMVNAVAEQMSAQIGALLWGETPPVAPTSDERPSDGTVVARGIVGALSGALRPPTLGSE
jgi:hypothetical protein